MPLYDYVCKACGHEFEALVRTGDVPSCPECRSADLDRQLSTFAMSSEERTREIVRAERKKRAPGIQQQKREEFEHTLREHQDH
jgi:putative FmdB family regulatory protein